MGFQHSRTITSGRPGRRICTLALIVAGMGLTTPQNAIAAKPFSLFADHVGKTGARKSLGKHIRRCRKANRTITECAVRRSRIPGFFSKATVAFDKSNKLFALLFHTRAGDAESIPKAMTWLDVDEASMSRAKMVFGRLITQGSTNGGLTITMTSSKDGVRYLVSAAN